MLQTKNDLNVSAVPTQKVDTKKTLKSVVLGGIAGGIAKTATYPLERIKTIGQTVSSTFGVKEAGRLGLDVLKQDGFAAFWKGNLVSIMRTVPYIGIAYGTYDTFEAFTVTITDDIVFARFLAGSCSGVVAASLTYPLDVIRSRMAASRIIKGYSETTVTHHEGLRWMFRGLGPTLIGVIPYAGLSFCVFETSKARLRSRNKTEKLTAVQNMTCGAVAGTVSQTLTYPIDTLRKRMQTDLLLVHNGERQMTSYVGGTWFQTAKGMIVQEGLKAFWRGCQLNFVKGITAAGFSFAVNESLKSRYLH